MTRTKSRWGCFVPDLTRLARKSVHHQSSDGTYRTLLDKMQETFDSSKVPTPICRLMEHFELDHRLQSDTIEIGDLALCRLLLMNDSRWPWLILVPKIANASEIHELTPDQQAILASETGICAETLKQLTDCEKINSASLGNIVRQLHIHVIARNEGDENWPGPVWGFGERVPYGEAQELEMVARLREEFQNKGLFSGS